MAINSSVSAYRGLISTARSLLYSRCWFSRCLFSLENAVAAVGHAIGAAYFGQPLSHRFAICSPSKTEWHRASLGSTTLAYFLSTHEPGATANLFTATACVVVVKRGERHVSGWHRVFESCDPAARRN